MSRSLEMVEYANIIFGWFQNASVNIKVVFHLFYNYDLARRNLNHFSYVAKEATSDKVSLLLGRYHY